MNIRGSDILLGVAGIGLGYALYKFFGSNFWQSLTFDPASLGPNATLTAGAINSQQDYIDRGYMAQDSSGNVSITPLGDKFIKRAGELYNQYLAKGMSTSDANTLARTTADSEISGLAGLNGYGRVYEGEII